MSQQQFTSSRTARRPDDNLAAAIEACSLAFGLDADAVAAIANVCTTHTFPARTEIFREGEECPGLWILVRGRVRLHHMSADGRHQATSFHAPASALEIGPALDRAPYTSTAAALEDAVLAFIPRRALVQLGQLYPVTIRNVIQQLCVELRQRDIATAVAVLKDARGRIGCALLQLMRQYGVRVSDGIRIDYRITRQDIADRSGVTIETSVRVLSELQRKGVLRTNRQVIDIVDVAAIREMAGCPDCQFDCSVFARRRDPGLSRAQHRPSSPLRPR
jgi:CRP/FNR family transcriptional regulator, nitrogen oxide reductase regulator